MTVHVFFQIACDANCLPSEKDMTTWIEKTALPHHPIELTLRFVEADEMTRLNKQYRKKENVTDILSFPFKTPSGIHSDYVGDIVLCPQRVKDDAEKQNKTLLHHWAHLIIHGTLHLMGYDHESDEDAEKMMTREIEILKKLNIPNPYEI